MGKPHSVELRSRVISYVDEGHGHRQTARHFRVSPKFVNDLLRRETGCLTPRRQGKGGGHGQLVDVIGWLEARVSAKSGITLDELVTELAETHGIDVHRATVWRVLRFLGLSNKKLCRRLNRSKRSWLACIMSGLRDVSPSWLATWSDWRSSMVRRDPATGPRATPNAIKKNIAKTTDWAPCGQRLVDHAPLGHWRTQTFVAALRHDRLDAPWVIDGAMNSEMFDLYTKTQ